MLALSRAEFGPADPQAHWTAADLRERGRHGHGSIRDGRALVHGHLGFHPA
jgi:hypothetical protein